MAKWSNLPKRVAPLRNFSKSESLELLTRPVFVTKASRLQKVLRQPQKEIESRGAKLAAMNEVGEKITSAKKEVPELLSSVRMLR